MKHTLYLNAVETIKKMHLKEGIFFSMFCGLYIYPLIFNAYADGVTSYLYQSIASLYTLIFVLYIFILNREKHGTESVNLTAIDLAVILWFLIITISLLVTNPISSLGNDQYNNQLVLFILFWSLKAVFVKSFNLVLLRKLFLFIGATFAFYGIYQFIVGLFLHSNLSLAVGGTFINPGIFAGYLVGILPYTASFLEKRNMMLWKVQLLICVLLVTTIFLTHSRAGVIAMLISASFLLITNNKGGRNSVYLYMILMGIPVLAYLFNNKQLSFGGRQLISKLVFQIAETTPPFGHGYQRFDVVYNTYQTSYFLEQKNLGSEALYADTIHYAFNEYLQSYIELGIPYLLLVALIATVIIKFKRSDQQERYIISSLLAIATFACFSYPFHIFSIGLILVSSLATLSVNQQPIFFVRHSKSVGLRRQNLFLCLLIAILSYQTLRMSNGIRWKRLSTATVSETGRLYKSIYPYMSDNGIFLLNYGVFLHNSGKFKESIEALTRSLQIYPSLDGYTFQADNYSNLDCHKSLKYYNTATGLIPSKLFPKYDLMRHYIEVGDSLNAKKMAAEIVIAPVKIPTFTATKIKEEASKILR